jgi:hypothetical protein
MDRHHRYPTMTVLRSIAPSGWTTGPSDHAPIFWARMLSVSKPFVVGYVVPGLEITTHLLNSTENPSISAACENLTIGKAYCVEALSEPAPTPSPNPVPSSRSSSAAAVSSTLATTNTSKPVVVPITSTPTSTKTSVTTSTSVGNGVSTPMPTQSGMAPNCNKFH